MIIKVNFSEKIKKFLPNKFLNNARLIKSTFKKIYFNIYRFFNKPNTNYLAIGESKEYFPPPYWTLMDIKKSDININFEKTDYKINNSNLKYIYSSHCIEHLTDDAINYLFKEIFANMSEDSIFRIETPDVKKIIQDYQSQKNIDYLKKIQQENFENLVLKRKMDEIYGEMHIAMLGLISCYIDLTHIPVVSSKEIFEEKLHSLSIDEFCYWAISLQSKEELLSHGHINFWHFERLYDTLKKIGFSSIQKCRNNQTFNKFDLSLERFHRRDYSLIVEVKI